MPNGEEYKQAIALWLKQLEPLTEAQQLSALQQAVERGLLTNSQAYDIGRRLGLEATQLPAPGAEVTGAVTPPERVIKGTYEQTRKILDWFNLLANLNTQAEQAYVVLQGVRMGALAEDEGLRIVNQMGLKPEMIDRLSSQEMKRLDAAVVWKGTGQVPEIVPEHLRKEYPWTGMAGERMPSGAIMTPEGEYISARELERPPEGERYVSPFEGAIAGPLGMGIAGAGAEKLRWQARTGDIAREQRYVQEALEGLPSARAEFYKLLEGMGGMSPAMRDYFMSRYPYMMEMFGGEEKREKWVEAQARQKAELARLGEKRRGQQWILGKKLPYIATGPGVPSPYIESYQQTKQKIASLQRREERLKKTPKTQDPWARFLAEYPFMEEYLKVSPEQRGERAGMFAPVTRWLVY